MKESIDVTKIPGYRPEWSIKAPSVVPVVEEQKRTVPKIISPRIARKITAAYRCAACWSDLILRWHVTGEYAGNYTIECAYCGGDVPGFVTRTYIDYRIKENDEEYRQARLALQEAMPFLFKNERPLTIREKRSHEATMKELGF